MRGFWFATGGASIAAAIFACSSFASAPTDPDLAADGGNDAARPTDPIRGRFCDDAGTAFFCSDFDLDASTPAVTLYPSPSKPAGSAGDDGTIDLVEIDGSVGGSAPRAARIAIQASAGATEKLIQLEGIASDTLTCTIDLLVQGAPTNEAFDVMHFFTTPSDANPRGLKIELLPNGSDNYDVELRYDIGSGSVPLGTMPGNVFRTITLSIDADGHVSTSLDGTMAPSTFDLGTDAGIDKITFGLHRKEAATIYIDDILCTK